MATQAERSPWSRLPGETVRWYARFEVYRLLGQGRTLEAAYRACAEAEGLSGQRPSAAWYASAREWNWEERAAAWDATEREALRSQEQERRFDARERRLAMIDELLAAVFQVLVLANLPRLSEVEARAWLPTARILFRDLLTAQRMELPPPTAEPATPESGLPAFTADELAQAARELDEWAAAAEPPTPAERPKPIKSSATRCLLVVVGDDPSLRVDLAALRAVKRATGLAFHRLTDATADDLERYLRRERAKGRPVELLHLAVHASHQGIRLHDGLVDGDWLSERLLGVQVLLLAGCEGDRVGDWLGVVPHVVTLAEAIGHGDAATLTEQFWTAIGSGLAPGAALAAALEKCAPAVSEYVVRHW